MATTSATFAASRVRNATTASCTARSHRAPIATSAPRISRNSSSNSALVWFEGRVIAVSLRSSETTADVVLGPRLFRSREDRLRRPDLDELAHVEEGGALRDARG